jgi:ABC-type bacteriocin/lantibiotic exporter with double-glycine peptidase domain
MRRVPKVRQHDASDCGVACLAAIARYHGQRVSLARLRQASLTDQAGSSLLGLTRGAESLGYAAKGVRAVIAALPRAPMPLIAHVVLDGGGHHYVVVERADERRVWVMDPAAGERSVESSARFAARWTGVLLLLAPHAGAASAPQTTGRSARIWQLVVPHRGALLQAVVGALVYTILALTTSVYVQQVVDGVLAEGRTGPLHVLSVAMIGVAVAQAIIGVARSVLMIHVGQHIDAALILGYYRHLLSLPQRFFDRMRVGELTSRITDAVKIRAFVADVAVEAVANVLIVTTSAAMMFTYDWRLAVCTLATLPLYATLYGIGARVNRRQQRTLMERAAALESQLVESLGAIATIKRFGLEPYAESSTESRFVRLFRGLGDAARTTIWIGGSAQLIGRLSTISLLWLGATRALAQELSAGELMSCYALLGFLTGPMTALVGFSRTMQEARVASERLFEIMELEPEPVRAPVSLVRSEVGALVLEGISFRYGGRETALNDVSFTCARGSITAIVGESGSGKSTIAALVQRLYPLDAGRIRIGVHDIAQLELGSLRRLVGVVPQTIDLFAGTVLENVVLGDPTPDVARVVRLCTELGLRDVIERMPHGWLTLVGERGVALSGGGRQRLAIVRALYREPAILILDEATSALDSINERLVLGVVQRIAAAGTTVLLIAHRLSAVQVADRVVMLDRGRLLVEGRHQTLMREAEAYRRIWVDQRPPVEAMA